MKRLGQSCSILFGVQGLGLRVQGFGVVGLGVKNYGDSNGKSNAR